MSEENAKTDCFLMSYEIPDVRNLEPYCHFYGEAEQHLGTLWVVSVYKDASTITFSLECCKSRRDKKWSIDTQIGFRICKTSDLETPFSTENHEFASGSFHKSYPFDNDFIENWTDDGKMKAEFQVKPIEVHEEPVEDSKFLLRVNYNTKFTVSKNLLVSKSEFFYRHKEDLEPEFEIKCNDKNAFSEFLQYLDGGRGLCNDTIESFLEIAKKFEFHSVFKTCADFLIKQSTIKKVNKLKIAERFGLESVIEAHFQELEDPFLKFKACPQCGKEFKETPDALECDHIFCKGCILVLKIDNGFCQCPLCGQHSNMANILPCYAWEIIMTSERSELDENNGPRKDDEEDLLRDELSNDDTESDVENEEEEEEENI